MGKVYTATTSVKSLNVSVAQPLDVRGVVANISDLYDYSTFGTSYYVGMMTYVVETGEIYVLKSAPTGAKAKTTWSTAAVWEKVGSNASADTIIITKEDGTTATLAEVLAEFENLAGADSDIDELDSRLASMEAFVNDAASNIMIPVGEDGEISLADAIYNISDGVDNASSRLSDLEDFVDDPANKIMVPTGDSEEAPLDETITNLIGAVNDIYSEANGIFKDIRDLKNFTEDAADNILIGDEDPKSLNETISGINDSVDTISSDVNDIKSNMLEGVVAGDYVNVTPKADDNTQTISVNFGAFPDGSDSDSDFVDGIAKISDIIAYVQAEVEKKKVIEPEFCYTNAALFGETVTNIYTMHQYELTGDETIIEVVHDHEGYWYNGADDVSGEYDEGEFLFNVSVPDGYSVTISYYDEINNGYIPCGLVENGTVQYGSKIYNNYLRDSSETSGPEQRMRYQITIIKN